MHFHQNSQKECSSKTFDRFQWVVGNHQNDKFMMTMKVLNNQYIVNDILFSMFTKPDIDKSNDFFGKLASCVNSLPMDFYVGRAIQWEYRGPIPKLMGGWREWGGWMGRNQNRRNICHNSNNYYWNNIRNVIIHRHFMFNDV